MSLVSVDLLEPNKWNPNVMQETEYQALKRDMELRGPRGVDPILVSIKNIFYSEGPVRSDQYGGKGYIIIDGEHRWHAAKELGWKEVLCTIESIQEDEAKGICYRRNRERGNIDPFKEAALFHSEFDQKLSQKQIADKYLVDPSTVSHRLSLLRIPPKIIETVRKLPRGTITPSHLEPIATLEPEDQKKFELKAYYSDGFKSVKQIETEVARIKEMRAEEKALAEAVKTAKFPKCPKCKREPVGIHYKKLPWVHCGHGHDWNLKTGKGLYEPIMQSQNKLTGEPAAPIKPKTLRCTHTIKELLQVFTERAKESVPKMDKIERLRVDGKLNGEEFDIDLSSYGKSMAFSIHQGKKWRGFRAEEHEYRSGEKSAVDTHSPDYVEDVKNLIDVAFQGQLTLRGKEAKKEEASAP